MLLVSHLVPLLLTRTVSVAVDASCDVSGAWCSQLCDDVGDSFECRCHAGYQLNDDGRSCDASIGKSYTLLLDILSFINYYIIIIIKSISKAPIEQ